MWRKKTFCLSLGGQLIMQEQNSDAIMAVWSFHYAQSINWHPARFVTVQCVRNPSDLIAGTGFYTQVFSISIPHCAGCMLCSNLHVYALTHLTWSVLYVHTASSPTGDRSIRCCPLSWGVGFTIWLLLLTGALTDLLCIYCVDMHPHFE